MGDSPDHRWLSYREIAEALGLPSIKAAAHRTRRAGWKREEGNGPAIRVAVPVSVLEGARSGPRGERSAPAWGGPPQPSPGGSPPLPNGALVGELREQLARSQGELDGLREALRVAETAAAEANQRAAAAQAEAAARRESEARERERAEAADAARQAAEQERDAARAELTAQREQAARAVGEAATRQEGEEREAARAARAEAAREAARAELAEWTAGGPIARAWRALVYRRGRP